MGNAFILLIYISSASFILFHVIKCELNQNILIEKEILDSLFTNYDRRVRPGSGRLGNISENDPAIVTVNMYLRSISKIDDVSMEYSVQLTFREEWNDERLKFDNRSGKIEYVNLQTMENIWQPDLFFANEKKGHFHDMLVRNLLLRIYPNGNILFSIRISLLLSCPMSLEYYPLDRQRCYIEMISYAYTTKDIIFVWKENNPIQIIKNLHLPSFTLERTHTSYCTSKTNTGEYSCLRVELLLRREFSYYLLQLYIPSFMLVIVSWVSFWLDKDAVPARVSLGVTTLLTMATQSSGINAKLPPVSYTKAIDIWIGSCLTFIFGALLEFALVNYVARKEVLFSIKPNVSNNPNGKPIADKKSPKSITSSNNDASFYGNGSTSVLINKCATEHEKYQNGGLAYFRGQSKDEGNDDINMDYEETHRPLIEFCECGAPLTKEERDRDRFYECYGGRKPTIENLLRDINKSWKVDGFTNDAALNEVSFMIPEYNCRMDNINGGGDIGGNKMKRHHSSSSLRTKKKLNKMVASSAQELDSEYKNDRDNIPHQSLRMGTEEVTISSEKYVEPEETNKEIFKSSKKKKTCCHSFLKKYRSRAKRIDVLSRIFFPLAFMGFNIVYWITYIS